MKNFSTGLITGSILGTLGITYFLSDKRTKTRLLKDSKKLMKKGKNMIYDIYDIF